jgi:hypothetical protein
MRPSLVTGASPSDLCVNPTLMSLLVCQLWELQEQHASKHIRVEQLEGLGRGTARIINARILRGPSTVTVRRLEEHLASRPGNSDER